MGKIRILSDELVSKIAAGEIVERPASVVKELLENSIDAGSTRIRTDLKGGGKTLIQVSDDGEGMTRDEALLSLERHATSKINELNDLFSVRTLGFRGEALPSIASVSRFTLTTKAEDELAGTKVSVAGGTIKSVDETGCPKGTTIEVKNLFYNTPPRRKFMKTNRTELSHILDVFQREALSSPGIGFQLTHNGNPLIRLSKRDSLEKRIREVFPDTDIHRLEAQAEGIKVWGYLSTPEDTRSTTGKLFTYVNRRGVKDRFLTRMVIGSYGKLLSKGKFPQGALFVEIPAGEVDVNVHPTKNEVRFKRARVVGNLIESAIYEMLRQAPWIEGYGRRVGNAVEGFFERRESYEGYSEKNRFNPHSITKGEESARADRKTHLSTEELHNSNNYDSAESNKATSKLFGKGDFFSGLEIIGQLGELYVICESKSGMILIDQHAAHERITYEKLKSAYAGNSNIQMQEILIPPLVELSAYESDLLRSNFERIERLGVKIEEFGDRAFRVRAIPALINDSDPGSLLKDMIAEIAFQGEERSVSEKVDHVISTMACHGSVRASQALNREKLGALLDELSRAEFPHACPHGRPVAREITFKELERMFGRT